MTTETAIPATLPAVRPTPEPQATATVPPGGKVAFQYQGHDVSFDANQLVSLTDMWKAAGSPVNQDPRQWRKLPQALGFIDHIAKTLNVAKTHLWKASRGRHTGGTWAHWQIALAYAKYLSHDFHRFVNEAFREWAEEKADPELKLDRTIAGYRQKGRSDRWISERLEGKAARISFTSTLQDHRVAGRGFADCTDAMNVKVAGGTAKEIRRARGLPPSGSTRDCLSAAELAGIRLAEVLAEESIRKDRAFGNEECVAVCIRAGNAVRTAMSMMSETAA